MTYSINKKLGLILNILITKSMIICNPETAVNMAHVCLRFGVVGLSTSVVDSSRFFRRTSSITRTRLSCSFRPDDKVANIYSLTTLTARTMKIATATDRPDTARGSLQGPCRPITSLIPDLHARSPFLLSIERHH